MTSAAGIFAGGDCVFGPRLIIDSVGDGKRAAVGIDEFLRGGKHPEPVIEVELLKRHACRWDFWISSASPYPCCLSNAAPA
jgi:heterodisulfide reductase subunit A-like polyferredoxin